MYDANALIKSVEAISVLRTSGVLTQRSAKSAAKTLIEKLNACVSYWSDKGQWDIVDALNTAYRAACAL